LILIEILVLTQQKDPNIKEVQSVLASIDTDGNGTINYTGLSIFSSFELY